MEICGDVVDDHSDRRLKPFYGWGSGPPDNYNVTRERSTKESCPASQFQLTHPAFMLSNQICLCVLALQPTPVLYIKHLFIMVLYVLKFPGMQLSDISRNDVIFVLFGTLLRVNYYLEKLCPQLEAS